MTGHNLTVTDTQAPYSLSISHNWATKLERVSGETLLVYFQSCVHVRKSTLQMDNKKSMTYFQTPEDLFFSYCRISVRREHIQRSFGS